MKKLIISFIIFLIFAINNLYAQTKIYGKITDEETNEPLSNVSVYVIEINKATKSDINGYYELNNLPSGKLTLEFSKFGFKTFNTKINYNSEEFQLDVKLSRAIIKTEEIVVSGIFNTTQHDNAVKIDVINTQDILKKATPNFMESITSVPGVDMISKGSGVSKPVIRGFSMNDVLVLNNGVRVENYQYSENHPLGIDEFGIDRVEIIKGPASLLYGSDAIGGVLNLIREKPAPTGKILGDATLQYHSNTNGYIGNVGLKGASNNLFGSLRIGGKSNADYLQPEGVFVPNSRFNEWSLKSNFGIFTNIGSFCLDYQYNTQNLGMTVPPSIAIVKERGRKNEVWYQDLNNHFITSNNNIYIGKYNLNITASYQNVRRKLQTTLNIPFIEMNLGTFYYNIKINFPSIDKFEYILGLQGKIQNHKNVNNRPSQFLPDMNSKSIALYSLFQLRLLDDLKFQAGLRYDYNDIKTEALGVINTYNYIAPLSKNYNNISGSIGAVYNINKFFFRFNFASAYRTPTLSELTSRGMHGNRYEEGNSALSTLHAYETDISVHYIDNNMSIDIAGFYNKAKDYIFITPTNDTTPSGFKIYRYSQTNSDFIGGEIAFHAHPKMLEWLHFETHLSTVNAKMENGEYLPFIPATKLMIELRGQFSKLWVFDSPFIEINTLTAFKKDNVSIYETSTDGYTLLNIATGLTYYSKNYVFNFIVSVNNLLDKKYYDHLSTLKPLFYNMGRNITFSLKTSFPIKN